MKKASMHSLGHKVINIGMGLLFVWGGLEKFFEGFMGGVGLQNMAGFLGSIGFGFLGEGTYYLGILVALVELVAGIMLLVNYKVNYAYIALTGIIAVAVLLVHFPSGDWMAIMPHIGILSALAGMALMTCEGCDKK